MNCQQLVLANGLRILLVPRPASLSAHTTVFVNVGAKDEQAPDSGLSHFLEHLLFDGTKTYREAHLLSEAFDRLGAIANGSTAYGQTIFEVSAAPNKIIDASTILFEMLTDSLLQTKDITKEKKVIVEELKRRLDSPPAVAQMNLRRLMYGANPPGRLVLGTFETLAVINRQQILSYYQKHYQPNRMVVVVAGNFSATAILKLIKVKLGHLKKVEPKNISAEVIAYSVNNEGQKQLAIKKELSQTVAVFGFPGVSEDDPRRYAYRLAATILGSGLSSRLYKRIRLKLGAAYDLGAWHSEELTHGIFGIGGGFDTAKFPQVIKAIGEELRRLKKDLVPADELTRIKDYLTGSWLIDLETPAQLADFYGYQAIAGQALLTPVQMLTKYQKVTALEIRQAAKDLFQTDKLFTVILNQKGDLPSFVRTLRL